MTDGNLKDVREIAADRRCCANCNWWNIHSFPPKVGDCMNHAGHFYARVPMPDGSFAMMDTFGRPTTPPLHVCEQFEIGDDVARHLTQGEQNG